MTDFQQAIEDSKELVLGLKDYGVELTILVIEITVNGKHEVYSIPHSGTLTIHELDILGRGSYGPSVFRNILLIWNMLRDKYGVKWQLVSAKTIT